MKKLVIMCVAVVAACVAQAANVQWNSGTLYLADGTTKAVKDDITNSGRFAAMTVFNDFIGNSLFEFAIERIFALLGRFLWGDVA